MTECAVALCDGSMQGQMLSCAPHWSLLTQPLRLALAAAWDDMARAVAQQNDIEGARRSWQERVAQAHVEWKAVRELLGMDNPRGQEWLRALRGLERSSAPTEGDVDAQGNALDDHAVWKERTGRGPG